MILTQENYHSTEASKKYMGVSQFKEFQKCEAKALARVNGEYEEEKTTALLVGSYVDAHYSKTLDTFKAHNPMIFTQKGELKAEYKHAEYIIERIERDPFFMKCMSGEKQVIKTGEIEGVPVKIMIDSYHPKLLIVDLKIMASMDDVWKKDIKGNSLKLNFVEAWGYDIQGAVYQEIEGSKLKFFLAVATKEKPEPDIGVFEIVQDRLDFCLDIVKRDIKRYHSIKLGEVEPTRCGVCDFCRRTRVLMGAVSYRNLG